jgi:hypothetical protein
MTLSTIKNIEGGKVSVKGDPKVEEALKQGKLVIVIGKCDAKIHIEGPKDKIKVIVRE